MFDLTGKTAIITGASRGIGEAIAWAYARAGANLTLSSRRVENILPVAEAINREFPDRVVGVPAHAGDPESAHSLVATAVERFGGLHIAVNNAATNPHYGSLLTAQESHWDKILEVNVKGYFWLCQAAGKQMLEQGSGGKIINNASIAGIRPGKNMGMYSVSKAAVIMLTKALALELAKEDIQVNAIAPGFVRTKFSAAVWDNPELAQEMIGQTPAGRIAEPEEIAGIALYLASSASNYATGETFVVDGGFIL